MKPNDNQTWRFWPVLCSVFIFAFSSPLTMVATPIYFFQQGLQIKIISLLTTAITISYGFSPILFIRISNKLGRRRSIIISMVGATLTQFLFYISLNPVLFFIERIFEGLILGLFFPNLNASISDNPNLDHNKYLARFNLTWSSAIVFGLIFGTFFLLFVEELKFIFYITPVLLLLSTIISIIFLQNPINSKDNTQNINIGSISSKQEENNASKYSIPILVPILFIFTMSFASGISGFLYPIKSELLGFQPASTYFLSIFSTLTQSIGMYLAGTLMIKKVKMLTMVSIISLVILTVLFEINEVYFNFIILFSLLGFFSGFLYGTASRLFIYLNVVRKTSKYSSISESLTGVAFFMTQSSAGIIADINLGLAFYSFTLVLIIIFFLNLVLIRKVKTN